MAVQNFVSAPARDNSFKNPSNNDGPGGANVGATGGSIKGFGGGAPHSSTINASGGPVGKSPQKPGASVKGFSDGGLISAKI